MLAGPIDDFEHGLLGQLDRLADARAARWEPIGAWDVRRIKSGYETCFAKVRNGEYGPNEPCTAGGVTVGMIADYAAYAARVPSVLAAGTSPGDGGAGERRSKHRSARRPADRRGARRARPRAPLHPRRESSRRRSRRGSMSISSAGSRRSSLRCVRVDLDRRGTTVPVEHSGDAARVDDCQSRILTISLHDACEC